MELLDSFLAIEGKPLKSWDILYQNITGTQNLTIYKSRLHGHLCLGFGGTKPMIKDWISNFKFWKKTLSVGSTKYKAHQGFVEEYLSLRDKILETIRIYQPECIFLRGFSQGGALATLCHRDLLANIKSVNINSLVFASPRIYSFSSAREFDLENKNNGWRSSFIRVSHPEDPVPHLPPWIFNFKHVGSKWNFPIVCDPQVGEMVHDIEYYRVNFLLYYPFP